MNISTKGRYGLRAVLDLATNYGDRPIVLSTIAERQDISEGYLEQLMGPLKKAGIIASARGAQGGYYLARDPKEIYVGEVFRALEGPLALVACISEENTEECERKDYCGSAFIWWCGQRMRQRHGCMERQGMGAARWRLRNEPRGTLWCLRVVCAGRQS